MTRPKSELLTAVELEFMLVLWRLGPSTVREVLDGLSGAGQRAYTSVATTLKILHSKGYLSSQMKDRAILYKPTLTKTEYETKTLKSLAKTLFNGTPTAMVARLVEDENLSDETIKEIKDIIDTRFGSEDD